MPTVELAGDPSPEQIKRAIDRIETTGAMPRGIAGGRSLEYDDNSETLVIDFDHLRRVLLEHRMYEEAKGFSDTQMDILRAIEAGPERMSLQEIKSTVNKQRTENGLDELSNPTFQHHLRELRQKSLVDHQHNQYTYVGP